MSTVKQDLEQVIASTDSAFVQETLRAAYARIQELEEQVQRDALTRVYNRRRFTADMEELDTTITLLMVDIDYFKKVNDTEGHQKGDEILYAVAQTLEKYIRKADTVYRYGGEEFAVILPDTDSSQAKKVMEKLREKVEEETGVTISIGAAQGYHDLLKSADDALYKAKESGRNCCVYLVA